MINQTVLLDHINSLKSKADVNSLTTWLRSQSFDIKDLLTISMHHDPHIAYIASWIFKDLMLATAEHDPDLLTLMFDYSRQTRNTSAQRHFAKIFANLTLPQAHPSIKQTLNQIDLEPIVALCFDWLMDEKILVAVKVWAAETLFNLRQRYSWISEELPVQLQKQMTNGSPAMLAAGRRLLKKL